MNEARGWRHRQRLEKRILHNRTAKQLGRHVLVPFDEKQNLKCMVCQKTIRIGRIEEPHGIAKRDQLWDRKMKIPEKCSSFGISRYSKFQKNRIILVRLGTPRKGRRKKYLEYFRAD